MFKCFDSQDQREIIILDSEWEGDLLSGLRSRGRSERLLCPQCEQPVHVKAGEVKAWHFAHKDLASCPLRSESPAVLKARGLLYKWLLAKFAERDGLSPADRATITVEKHLSDDIPGLADCYVELPDGTKLAYWIFNRGMRDRLELKCGLKGITLRPVFLASMLRPVQGVQDEEGSFDLTPTERDFMEKSDYDAPYSWTGKSLHYLNEENGNLTTLRGISIEHSPQRYSSQAVFHDDIMDVLTNQNGEFIHPGEHEGLQQHQRKAEERRKLIQIRQQRRDSGRTFRPEPTSVGSMGAHTFGNNRSEAQPQQQSDRRETDQESPITSIFTFNAQMTCVRCGKKTKDWTECKYDEGTCICRECLHAKTTQ